MPIPLILLALALFEVSRKFTKDDVESLQTLNRFDVMRLETQIVIQS